MFTGIPITSIPLPSFFYTLFLIAPGIVLVLADNKGDKCNAYCKSLWLGLGHDTCQPMINWLCVCSISNAKLYREGKREREKNMMENWVKGSEGVRCRHVSGTVRGGCLRCWMFVCGAQIRQRTSLRTGCLGCPRPWTWTGGGSWQKDRC